MRAKSSENKIKKGANGETSKYSIQLIGAIIILASVVGLLICLIGQIYISEEQKILGLTVNLFINLCITGVTVGAGTILYGYFDFVNYITTTIKNIIVEYDFVKHLNQDEKELLLSKISKDVIYHDENCSNDTLYDFVNSEVRDLIDSYYYEKMELLFNCRIDKEVIIKDVTRTVVVNFENDDNYKFDLRRITKCGFKCKEENKEKIFDLNLLEINDENLTDKIEFVCEQKKDNSDYCYTCYYQFKSDYEFDQSKILKNDKKILKIKLEYTTRVEKDDLTMGFRVYAPCKSFDSTFVYDKTTVADVYCDVFAFKDRVAYAQKMDEERITYVKKGECICVKVNNWILPGDGVIYIITPK